VKFALAVLILIVVVALVGKLLPSTQSS